MGQNDRRRLSHYIPAELVDEFNQRADEHEPSLQRQVYFEHIIRLGLIADVVLEDMVRALKGAAVVFNNLESNHTELWKNMAATSLRELHNVRLKAENEGVEFHE